MANTARVRKGIAYGSEFVLSRVNIVYTSALSHIIIIISECSLQAQLWSNLASADWLIKLVAQGDPQICSINTALVLGTLKLFQHFLDVKIDVFSCRNCLNGWRSGYKPSCKCRTITSAQSPQSCVLAVRVDSRSPLQPAWPALRIRVVIEIPILRVSKNFKSILSSITSNY